MISVTVDVPVDKAGKVVTVPLTLEFATVIAEVVRAEVMTSVTVPKTEIVVVLQGSATAAPAMVANTAQV